MPNPDVEREDEKERIDDFLRAVERGLGESIDELMGDDYEDEEERIDDLLKAVEWGMGESMSELMED